MSNKRVTIQCVVVDISYLRVIYEVLNVDHECTLNNLRTIFKNIIILVLYRYIKRSI